MFLKNAKSKLLKNTPITFLVILLASINFVYTYLTIFLNKKQLLFKKTDIFTKYFIISLSLDSFLSCFFLLLVILITLNSLYIN